MAKSWSEGVKIKSVALTKVPAVQRDDLQIIIVDTWTEKQILKVLECRFPHSNISLWFSKKIFIMVSTQPVVKNTNKTKARVASPWLHYNRCGRLKRGLTKVIAVVVPALIASPLLLLVQSLFSVFIIFLPQVFVLQNLVGSIHLQELLMG